MYVTYYYCEGCLEMVSQEMFSNGKRTCTREGCPLEGKELRRILYCTECHTYYSPDAIKRGHVFSPNDQMKRILGGRLASAGKGSFPLWDKIHEDPNGSGEVNTCARMGTYSVSDTLTLQGGSMEA